MMVRLTYQERGRLDDAIRSLNRQRFELGMRPMRSQSEAVRYALSWFCDELKRDEQGAVQRREDHLAR